MSTPEEKELLDDAIALVAKLKNERKLWNGEVGLSPMHREDINDLIRRHRELNP